MLGTYRFGDCEVDFQRMELKRAGTEEYTSALEFMILAAFIRCRGHVPSRRRLLEMVWGEGAFVTDRVFDTHIANILKKIEPEPGKPDYLVGLRGMGYRFDG